MKHYLSLFSMLQHRCSFPLLFSFFAFVIVWCGAVSAQVQKPLPTLHVEGKWLVDTHGNHVVLHGVMDTPSMWFNGYDDNTGHHSYWSGGYNETGTKNCLAYFEKLYKGLETAHCNVFRLHLDPAWTNDPNNSYTYPVAQAQPDGTDGEANIRHFNPTRLRNFMKTLYFPLAKQAMNHKMYVLMRPPGVCPGTIKVGGYYQKYLMEVWDIVTQNDSVRKYSGQLSIELANEPVSVKNSNGEDDAHALHDFFQPIVDMIRANGFTGIIWVPGAGWQSSYADYKTYPITGYNIGYAVHDYDGWYGCEDKKLNDSNVAQAAQNKIRQFRNQVPVVDTNPVIITEIDWSPKNPGSGHTNEHGEYVESNYGTWATGRTSYWGRCFKTVHDHYGNISMTLSGTHCLLDIRKLLATGKPEPAFNGLEEACGKACWDWYADYYTKNFPQPDLRAVPTSDYGKNYQNPIVRADFPDPDVIRVGDTYYMVSTTMYLFPGATIIKSKDLVNWEYCAQPLKKLLNTDKYNLKNDKNAYASGMWASSLKYHEGKFYLLVNGNDDRAWLLTATNPEGEWEVKRLSRNYYDPGMLFDNGKVYIVCGINHLMMCELDSKFNFRRERKVVEREGTGLEGCHLYKIGDYYYIYATYGGWPSGQVAFRSKDIFGPYEEKMLVEKWYDNVPNTIHQGSLVDDVEGKWWTVMQEDLGALGRMPNLQPVKWEDGWPVIGKKGKPYASFTDKIARPANNGDNSVKRLPTNDTFREYPLGMQWEWSHNPVDTAWSVFERPSWLRLKTTAVTDNFVQARNTLTQRIFADQKKASTATVRLDVSALKEGDRAGICIFQDPYALICVERKADGYQVVWQQDKVRDTGNTFAEKHITVQPVDGIIYLRASIKYGENKTKFFYSLDNSSWRTLGNETSQSFNLSVFVGSRFGIFCYATKEKGGYADFDWFTTEDSFNEDETCPAEFTAPDSTQYLATKLAVAQKTYTAMYGHSQFPIVKATYKDKTIDNVARLTTFTPETAGIVDFAGGEMFGIGQGKTKVTASYTDLFGNAFDATFDAVSSYFPFDPQYVSPNITGQGNYKQLASGNANFKFSANNLMGWNYNEPIDMSEYKYLVIDFAQKPGADFYLGIYTSNSLTGPSHTSDALPHERQVVIDLSETKNTSANRKGQPLNTKSVYIVALSSKLANKALVISNMYLTNTHPDDETPVTMPAADNRQPTVVTVTNLAGQVLRRNVNRNQALKGLPAGIYVVAGRKVLVR